MTPTIKILSRVWKKYGSEEAAGQQNSVSLGLFSKLLSLDFADSLKVNKGSVLSDV